MSKIIFFNKYIITPEDEIEQYLHNNVKDILYIWLKDGKLITINNFTFDDFNKITYKELIKSEKVNL